MDGGEQQGEAPCIKDCVCETGRTLAAYTGMGNLLPIINLWCMAAAVKIRSNSGWVYRAARKSETLSYETG